jgi:hypothetical protein
VKLPGRFGPRLSSHSFFWQRGLGSDAHCALNGKNPRHCRLERTIERVWAWIHETFPERQIYIRSNGRVQFFTFGPTLQATMAGLIVIFLGWVAFATVNVVFKDRIITAKDRRYQQMQAAYEGRLTDLQISYDQLSGALVGAEDKFKATADMLATKQNVIAKFLDHKARTEVMLGADRDPPLPEEKMTSGASMDETSSEGVPDGAQTGLVSDSDADSGSTLSVMPEPVAAQPMIAKPNHASLLERTLAALERIAAVFFPAPAENPTARSEAYAHHPGLHVLARETARVEAIADGESRLMDQARDALSRDVVAMRDVVRRTGLNPAQFARKQAGEGGPEIPLDRIAVDGLRDRRFNTAYLEASAMLSEVDNLSREMGHVPLSLPVLGANFELSSGFGPRLDPFSGRYAFHSGMDFAAPWGTPVCATAAGTVIFAGVRGSYGNMVEIDHGMGLHTRYGHLSKITVRVGMKVEKGTALGRLGSTGRSTGPHVHYEVWYDDAVRNPRNFIEAGHHVL